MAGRGREALDALRAHPYDVVLTDLIMPGDVDGMDILKTIRTLELSCPVILMTAFGTIETAVQAMKAGAYDFITKPIRKMQVTKTVERALETQRLRAENRELRAQLSRVTGADEIVGGQSTAMRQCLSRLHQAAPSTASILIQGESGTGKELFARAVHRLSLRAEAPFVAVNCAALPESILESELFGYEKGAFTGAFARKEGLLMAAHAGSLFLDEIADMSLPLQAKLLRVLQEGSFERVGGTTPIHVDFRLIAATNRDLREAVKSREFREDLYYRLQGITLSLPPLRSRGADILPLAQHFIRKYSAKNGKAEKPLSGQTLAVLEAQPWPGNVRELEKAVERAVILANGEELLPGDFFETPPLPPSAQEASKGEIRIPFGTTLEEVERLVMKETLRRTAGDKRLAAQILGIAARTIYRKADSLD